MSALDIILVALAQSSVSSTPAAQVPDGSPVEVVAPSQPDRRRVCRPVLASNSRIPSRRVCQTRAEWEEQREEEQADAEQAMNPTNERTGQQVNTSGYGNYARDRWLRPIGGPR